MILMDWGFFVSYSSVPLSCSLAERINAKIEFEHRQED
jgi:hypothetical protein